MIRLLIVDIEAICNCIAGGPPIIMLTHAEEKWAGGRGRDDGARAGRGGAGLRSESRAGSSRHPVLGCASGGPCHEARCACCARRYRAYVPTRGPRIPPGASSSTRGGRRIPGPCVLEDESRACAHLTADAARDLFQRRRCDCIRARRECHRARRDRSAPRSGLLHHERGEERAAALRTLEALPRLSSRCGDTRGRWRLCRLRIRIADGTAGLSGLDRYRSPHAFRRSLGRMVRER